MISLVIFANIVIEGIDKYEAQTGQEREKPFVKHNHTSIMSQRYSKFR